MAAISLKKQPFLLFNWIARDRKGVRFETQR
jgi:hypothetical protein